MPSKYRNRRADGGLLSAPIHRDRPAPDSERTSGNARRPRPFVVKGEWPGLYRLPPSWVPAEARHVESLLLEPVPGLRRAEPAGLPARRGRRAERPDAAVAAAAPGPGGPRPELRPGQVD